MSGARAVLAFAIAIAGALMLGASAQAATIVFDLVPAEQPTTACPAPCFNVRVFFEDPTRNDSLVAIVLDIDVIDATTTAAAGNVEFPNVGVEDSDGNVAQVPFALTAGGVSIAASPTPGFDVLIAHASDTRRSVNSLAQLRTDALGCTPTSLCTTQLDALGLNRIYLGRFNVSGPVWSGDPQVQTRIRFTGERHSPGDFNGGQWIDGHCGFGGNGECVAPEPAGVVLLGAALMALGLARRCSRRG